MLSNQSNNAKILIGFWSYYEEFCKNNLLFTDPSVGWGEHPYRRLNRLREECAKKSIEILTIDLIDDFSQVDIFLFSDFPRMKNKLVQKAFAAKKPMFLIIEEPEVVHPDNWKLENHILFSKIFTNHDGYVDNKKYFKYNTFCIEPLLMKRSTNVVQKEKLCAAIWSNKRSLHPLELYSKRREIIRWFEKYHPDDFDLYGYGWDTYSFPHGNKHIARLNSKKLFFLRKRFREFYPSWRGPVKDIFSVLRRYKFAFAFENTRDTPGQIQDRIFLAFFSNTVPVYRGASNVNDHIPSNCFIDLREFATYKDLYDFLVSINDSKYFEYLDNIDKFLNSERSYQFTSKFFVKVVLDQIEDILQIKLHP
ncbi:MAG TPA: glycosyltransferase family 10 domain-containing protein [Candidatus Brocadiaceae bacterium]